MVRQLFRIWLSYWPPALWRYDKERQKRKDFPDARR